jgi:hypothetical protein
MFGFFTAVFALVLAMSIPRQHNPGTIGLAVSFPRGMIRNRTRL